MDHAPQDDVVEEGRDEESVVQHVIGQPHGKLHPGQACHDKDDEKAEHPHHGHLEADGPPVQGEDPIEDHGPDGDGEDQRRETKEGVSVGPGAQGQEVKQRHQDGQEGDAAGSPHHGGVAEEALAAEGGRDLGEDAERGQHQHADLGKDPGPDKVHVDHGVAAQIVREEVGAGETVQRQQEQRRHEHREDGDDQHVGAQGAPGEERHLHEAHAGAAHLHEGDDEVDRRQHGPHPGDQQRPHVIVHPHVRTELDARERRIREPSNLGKAADKQREHHQCGAKSGHPEAQVAQKREGRAPGADLQRHEVVHEARDERHGHEEDHDHAVGREDLVVVMR